MRGWHRNLCGFADPAARTTQLAAAAHGGRRTRSELREEIRHLEGRAHRLRALVEPLLRLLRGVRGEHAERDRDAGLERGELEPARRLPRHVLEVRSLASDHAAERD